MGSILITDDSKTVRNFTKMTLTGLGFGSFKIVEAEDGKKGLEALRREHFDLVTTDFEMPNMDGFEFCKTILADPVLSKVPLIVISAMSNAQKAEFEKIGCKRILFKPLESKQIREFLRELFPSILK